MCAVQSTKKLFKVKSMNFIANRSLNLCYWAILSNHVCFQHNRALFIPVFVKKDICSSVSDDIDNSTLKNKKPIKKLLVLKRTKFHVKLRNF